MSDVQFYLCLLYMRKKIQNGGILIKNKNPKESINFFIDNCKRIKLLSKSTASGAVFECSLKNGVESPYEMIRSTDFKSPVKNLIVKLVGIDSDDNKDDYEVGVWEIPEVNDFTPKKIEQEETFREEINIQTQLFFKSMRLLNPWCPAPVYASIEKNSNDALAFVYKMLKSVSDSETRLVLEGIIQNINDGIIPYLGILGMEIADGYMGLYECYYYYSLHPKSWKPFIRQYENMVRLKILDMALESGYSQGDYHSGNILVNKGAKGYYDGIYGNILIIDFGLANKIPPEELQEMKQLVNEGKLVEALKVLNNLSRSDGLKFKSSPSFYGWLSYDYDNLNNKKIILDENQIAEENKKLLELKSKETLADDARVAFFNDELHSGERNKYPLLPLSNAVKNSFFEGIITGGKNNTRRLRKSQKKRINKYIKRKRNKTRRSFR